jgi:hypothetical protein
VSAPLALDSDRTWSELVKAYEKVDPLAVLPIVNRLVLGEVVAPGAECFLGPHQDRDRQPTFASVSQLVTRSAGVSG